MCAVMKRSRDVGEAWRDIKTRERSCNDVIDVNPAENLSGKIDPMRLAVPDPVPNMSAGTVNARQPKNADVRPQRLPRQIRLCPRATPASADRRGVIHPGAASVAINPSGRKVADPCRRSRRNGVAILKENRIAVSPRRDGRKNVSRLC